MSSKELPGWCAEHQATIDADGRCEWDKRVEQGLDGIRPPFPRRMSQEQIETARSALRRDREWYERQIWNHSLQLRRIHEELEMLAAKEAA